MGAASSTTVRESVTAAFANNDAGGKGYLTLREVLRLPPLHGVDPGHLGVLFAADRNRDGRFSLEEALAFASDAGGAARGARARDALAAAALAQGRCSLAMWRELQAPGGRDVFVQWLLAAITEDAAAAAPARQAAGPAAGGGDRGGWGDVPCVGLSAVKTLYRLFDIERCQGLRLGDLVSLMQMAAADLGLLPPPEDGSGEEAEGDGAASEGGASPASGSHSWQGDGGEEGEARGHLWGAGSSSGGGGGGGSEASGFHASDNEGGSASDGGSVADDTDSGSESGAAGSDGGGGGGSQASPRPAAVGKCRGSSQLTVPLPVVVAFIEAAYDGMADLVGDVAR